MTFHDDMTLGEARALLRELVGEGHECPLCTQYAKIYRRSMSATAARTLIVLWRNAGTAYTELGPILRVEAPGLAGRGESTHGHWFKLLEQPAERREDGAKGNGVWRVTERGVAWIERRITVPKYAVIYADRLLGYRGERVSITECLGKRFDYTELMNQ